MSILGGVGKDTVKEAGEIVDRAIPAAGEQVKQVEDHGIAGLSAVIVDFLNRINGANVPVDLTLTATVRLTGKIGDVHITTPDYEVSK